MCVRIWESDVHTKTVIYCVLLVPIRKTPPLVFRCNADEMFIWSLDLFDRVKSWFERLLKWGMRWVKITLTAAGRPFKSHDTALWNVKLFICKCYNITVKCTFINKHTHSVLCISFAGTVCECDIVYVTNTLRKKTQLHLMSVSMYTDLHSFTLFTDHLKTTLVFITVSCLSESHHSLIITHV